MKLIKGESLSLPLPRRLELPAVKQFRRLILGEIQDVYESFIAEDATISEFYGSAKDYLLQSHQGPQFDEQALRNGYLVTKHQVLGGSIFSVSAPLQAMLADTNLKDNIPIKFFTPPQKVSYIEFCPPLERSAFQLSAYAGGGQNICEGCYLQEKTVQQLPEMTREAREHLELDPQKPVRILDIGISVSPLHNPSFSDVETPIAADTVDTFSFYIQDETEPLSEALSRHFEFYKLRAMASGAHTGIADRELFQKRVTDVFGYLTKILMYLYIDKKARYHVSEATDLQERIEKVAEKKRPKLEKQLNRVYDRIIIGPKTYTPLVERIEAQNLPKGTKRPHYRSGYFGVRWKGTGQAKLPELVRVDELIVNKSRLEEDSTPTRRDYEIR